MCGIAGIYGYATPEAVDEGAVGRMCAALRHRGPDDHGIARDRAAGLVLGHTRLSIIDLAGGHQPMINTDGSVWVSFNGEIYNHPGLRAELSHRPFRTRSDTEVILALYEERGLRAFRALRGMFAIALWDRARRRLVLARDRLGIKPLYYTAERGRLVFASEVPALLEAGEVRRELDPVALRQFLALRAIPAPRTLLRGVHKLLPGHFLVCHEPGPEPQTPFWTLEAAPPPDGDETALTAELRARLERVVADHMLSDVPVGALLSGGLDSSVIVAAMRRATGGEIHTFSVGFAEAGFHEFPYARAVARRFATTHHERVLTPGEFVGFLPRMVHEFADPVADPAAVPLYFLAERIRALGLKVVLSGEGSDELFAGYVGYREYLAEEAPSSLRDLARRLRSRLRHRRLRSAGGRFYHGHAALPDPGALDGLLRDPAPPGDDPLDRYDAAARTGGLDALQRMLYIDLKTRIPEDLLCRTDRMTMAHSVEARVPFLDHELVEFGLRLPSRLKVREGIGKHLLKRAAEAWLPPGLIHRPKMGFPTPIRRWLTGELRPLFEHWLRERPDELGVLDQRGLARLLDRHFSGRADVSLLLWRVWFFKLWSSVWLAGQPLVIDPEHAGAAAVVSAR